MKDLSFIAVIAGVLVIWFLVSRNREGFSKEFIDRSNEEKTDQTRVSSYRQETNHFKPTTPLYEKSNGIETPFRVNQYNSYVPA
jgi:hypothetical protein